MAPKYGAIHTRREKQLRVDNRGKKETGSARREYGKAQPQRFLRAPPPYEPQYLDRLALPFHQDQSSNTGTLAFPLPRDLAMASKRSEIEARAQDAEQAITSKIRKTAALKAAIDSADLYMQALRLADTPADRKRLETKCNELLVTAEKLKLAKDKSIPTPEMDHPVSSRKLTTRENIIILEGSKLNGFVFRPWDRQPSNDEFDLKDGQTLFLDSPSLSLSDTQLEYFGGWHRPIDALSLLKLQADGQALPNEPSMSVKRGKVDLVQDLTSDCSVVASLCSGTARVERGHFKISGSIIYPYDQDNEAVTLSPNGKYVLKLFFNGCWRRVEIDDLLPTSTNARVLHVVDRSHPGLLWPALMEKAYLKVRGGYDFPGSNSGTDLAVLTGWIPQQIFLHDAEIEPDELWNEILEAFEAGNIFLTIGTGKLSRREQKQLGLAAEHDYAILEMKEINGVREMLIKNPWADGDVWKGAVRRKPHPHHDDDQQYPALPITNGPDEMLPGTFWMDFNSVFQHYENLYINWNPALFYYRYDEHFSWTLSQQQPVSHILDNNHQFLVRPSKTGVVWVLLNRHFRTGDYTHANSGKNGYISLYLYDRSGFRVLSSSGAQARGPFVDSPNTLLRFQAIASQPYTVVAVQQDLPAGKHNFTLSVFSKFEALLQSAASALPHKQSIGAAWTRATAGGNSDSANYLTNPQLAFKLDASQQIALVLKVTNADGMLLTTTDIHVKVLIVASDGRRITRLRPRDIVAHSGDYHRSSAVVEKILSKGHYTVICSTFEENELSNFSLDFYSASTSFISKLPPEGSGRLKISPSPVIFDPGCNKCLAPLSISRLNKITVVARQPQRSSTSSLFKLSLEQGQGPYKRVLADSGLEEHQFLAISTGLRIDDLILQPGIYTTGNGGLWLVLERLADGSQSFSETECIEVELLAENAVDVGAWGIGDG